MAYHSLQNKAPSPEYDRNHTETFGVVKSERFCPTCDRPRVWCECIAGVHTGSGTDERNEKP